VSDAHREAGRHHGQHGSGIPGLVRFDHVGLTVPDLDDASAFLVDVLGCEFLYSLGPYSTSGEWMATHLDVDPGASIPEIRYFRCGEQPVFEVFQYVGAPNRQLTPPRNSDIGGHHFALYVEDLDLAVAYLRSRGVTVLGDPTVSRGAHEGQRWVYFVAPWGAYFELVSYPNGRAWYREHDSGKVLP
jgi:catechol 2,3-dioxygenase-like lactoylglutathione lyase family enzyme